MSLDPRVIHDWIWSETVALPHPETILESADALLRESELDVAASLLDRAWGAHPSHGELTEARAKLLDRLSIEEHSIRFRYIPAGWFRQGSEEGDADERPRRRVELDAFWIADAPLTWLQAAALGDLTPPPDLRSKRDSSDEQRDIDNDRLIDAMLQRIIGLYSIAEDVDAPLPPELEGIELPPEYLRVVRRQSAAAYGVLPAVGLSFEVALAIASERASSFVRYSLPTEAQWERAARGGLRDARYPWGDAEPTARLADFDRFESFKLRPAREFAPNGYGLFAMAGTCREWCLDLYDAREYERSAERNPLAQPAASSQRVARGGSWADCAEAITVTFRSAMRSGRYFNDPTFGMRPVRLVAP